MRVLVVGGGGREHALAWRLSRDPEVETVLCAPGNAGTARVGENVAVAEGDTAALSALCRARAVDLAVIGPEAPLCAGVADALRAAGVAVLGPGREAAQLEGSKAFAKEIMATAGVPTAAFVVCDSAPEAHREAERMGAPLVVKADGLAQGKGVTVAMDIATAHAAIEEALVARRFGGAGMRLVLEAFLPGPEASAFALCDGTGFVSWPFARDHKRLRAGDLGPNTGGMGAITPPQGLEAAEAAVVGERVFSPTLAAMARRGAPFQGILYAGLKWTPDGPKVLEFNVRLGDPETQALVMTMRGSLAQTLLDAASGRRADSLGFAGAGAAVVAAARGYPEAPQTGAEILGDLSGPAAGAQVFLAGARAYDHGLRVSGGRVLAAAAGAEDLQGAIAAAYAALGRVRFAGMQVRDDIGRPVGG